MIVYECKMSMSVYDDYKVHDDSFILGCRLRSNGVYLTSLFCLGRMSYFGNTCYSSLKLMLKDEKLNLKLLKRYFCFKPFMNQILAMYQCKKCFKVIKRLLHKLLYKAEIRYSDSFIQFAQIAHFNTKKSRNRVIRMDCSFMDKLTAVKSTVLPHVMDHLVNGEFIHDCYYDICDSDQKLIFINKMQYVKLFENRYQLRSLSDLNVRHYVYDVDSSLANIKLCPGQRDLSYFRFVQETFDCYITF